MISIIKKKVAIRDIGRDQNYHHSLAVYTFSLLLDISFAGVPPSDYDVGRRLSRKRATPLHKAITTAGYGKKVWRLIDGVLNGTRPRTAVLPLPPSYRQRWLP